MPESIYLIMCERFRRFMEEERLFLRPGLNITHLAEMLNSNTNYTSRMVNRMTGMHFPTYISVKRLEHALNLLKETDLPVFKIATESGFRSYASFARSFYGYFGITPQTARKQVC